ncbi:MAG: hypothetical protein AAGD14_04370 [Planctomycetota bacterium]
MRPIGAVLWMALIVGCRSPSGCGSVDVGELPQELAAGLRGGRIACVNVGDHSISVIDVQRGREHIRIKLPVAEVDASGQETFDTISGACVDPGRSIVWAATTGGDLFAIDVATRRVRVALTDRGLSFSALTWDPFRREVLLATDDGTIGRARNGELVEVHRASRRVSRLGWMGERLVFVTIEDAIIGSGYFQSSVGCYDLRTRTLVFEHAFERGIAVDAVASTNDRLWVADSGNAQLHQFDALGNRRLSLDLGEFLPDRLVVSQERLLVSDRFQGRVLEFQLAGARMGTEPTGEYRIGSHGASAMLLMPDDVLAITVGQAGSVLLVRPSEAAPFTGYRFP